jgi:hypothetical protein
MTLATLESPAKKQQQGHRYTEGNLILACCELAGSLQALYIARTDPGAALQSNLPPPTSRRLPELQQELPHMVVPDGQHWLPAQNWPAAAAATSSKQRHM